MVLPHLRGGLPYLRHLWGIWLADWRRILLSHWFNFFASSSWGSALFAQYLKFWLVEKDQILFSHWLIFFASSNSFKSLFTAKIKLTYKYDDNIKCVCKNTQWFPQYKVYTRLSSLEMVNTDLLKHINTSIQDRSIYRRAFSRYSYQVYPQLYHQNQSR
jgi:hypothetical protein